MNCSMKLLNYLMKKSGSFLELYKDMKEKLKHDVINCFLVFCLSIYKFHTNQEAQDSLSGS